MRISLGIFLVAIAFPAIAEKNGNESSVNQAYLYNCSGCHGIQLEGTFGPPISGNEFRAKWKGKKRELRDYIIATMPPGKPDSLPATQYTAIADYVAKENSIEDNPQEVIENKAGEKASPEGDASGGQLGSVNLEDAFARKELARRQAVLESLSPITDKMLRSPPDEDWLSWRRTDDAHGFSPLSRLNKKNIAQLQLSWSLALPSGTNQIAPLVYKGVIFVNSSGTVQAIEATTGTVLWTFSRPANAKPLGPPASNPRGMALYGTMLFVPTIDNHMLALDIHSGTLVWDHHVEGASDFLRMSGAPIVVKGKVIQGISGCAGAFVPGGCFIVALDATDGHELWRFDTLAKSGTANDSWNGAPDDQRFGGSVWTAGSYDPDLDLVYFGTGQTYKITALMEERPGERNDALYTNSTLALDPDSGELVWHYQHMQREVWDLDWAFERTLANIRFRGDDRRVVMTMGKVGILDVLDAKTGEYLFSRDLGVQTIISKIDPETGVKVISEEAEPIPDQTVKTCPFPTGVRNFPSTTYDASSNRLYIPGTESCMNFLWRPLESSWDIGYQLLNRPGNKGMHGRVDALYLKEKREKRKEWTVRRRAPFSSAITGTAGGLLFEGTMDRYFRAIDSDTGLTLWKTRLADVPNAFPVSFIAAGKQCIAITTGGGGPADAVNAALMSEDKKSYGATLMFTFCES